jgi:DNA primase small subunit
MDEKTILFLKNVFKRYYFKNSHRIIFPSYIAEREFGYMDFEGSMIRHFSFKNEGELIAEILKQGPASVFCSNARYENPSLPIEEKGWKGAELIFDIDSDQIETGCRKSHDFWYCTKCYSHGSTPIPQACSKCANNITKITGRCNICIDAAFQHANKVVSILEEDFGVDRKEIKIYFSGNRGFHIHVFDKRFFSLNQDARLEIAMYISGESLPPAKSLALQMRAKEGAYNSGWLKRISEYMRTADSRANKAKLVTITLRKLVPKIDHHVTSDVHRIFRMAGTLHNKTGFLKVEVRGDDFDPNYEPVVLEEDKVKIKVRFYPSFSLRGENFGPFKDEVATIPFYAAVPILANGLGEVS